MLLNAGCENGACGRRTALREGPEQQAAAHVAGGVLDGGQMEGLGLRPVARDIVEVLGVGGDLLKDAPGGLDVGEVLFALILALPFVQQAMLAPDAFQSAMTERQIKLADEAASAESGQLLAEGDDLLFDRHRGLAGLVMGGTGTLDQTARSLLLIAAQPLADGGDGGLEQASRGFDAELSSRVHQTQAMIVGAAHFAYQGEIGSGHGPG
jgi:hypothetical protein